MVISKKWGGLMSDPVRHSCLQKRSVQSPRRWGWGIPLEKTTATERPQFVKFGDIMQDFLRMA